MALDQPMSIENNRLLPVDKNAVFCVRIERPAENHALQITPFSHQVADRILVGDSDDVLRDNRTLIQIGRYIVAGRTNNFYSAVVCLLVRVAANKGR